MKNNNIQLIIVITIFLALTASAFFFLKPETTGNVVLNPENTLEDTSKNTELNVDTTDTPTEDTTTTQNNIPKTEPTTPTASTTLTNNLFRSGRRGGGGGSSGGSSSGGTISQTDPVVEDKPTDDFIDVLKNSGKTESSVPPPEIPNII